ncbi:MAG: putative small multi-drug export protein [Candidatus Berkelbacteria bacterium Licking1014_7]|uniref:Putative small multi-drug export protein n=1 Tax=Candidatus Berkelbacteria bacterium Licking1014_7 TaxID=2017147 RepID=A0A554LHJ5_9BACT|nr:MAG: putative small multi-drug export protein [Candidatus Berkelbacteria bacterium Licking1014_7]
MIENISGISPQLKVFLMSMLPISELRLALPLALTVYHLSFWQAIFLTVVGNFIPAVMIIFVLGWTEKFLSSKSVCFARFFKALFERTHIKHNKKFEVWGAIALISFVAIPLPMTGAWTGALASFIFEIEKKKALIYILLGIIFASAIVAVITLGMEKIF